MWRRLFPLVVTFWISIFVLPDAASAQLWPSIGGREVSRDGKWVLPVIGGILSSDEDDHLSRGSVYAWDLSVPYGSYIFPMAAGRVSYAGCNNAGGYGCWVLVDHGDGYLSLYGHMIDEGGGTVRVRTGERVHVWTPLGRVGWTGMTSFGPHTHWEIHHAERGRVRNDFFFSRVTIPYCKFCAADSDAVQSTTFATYPLRLLSREVVVAFLLLLLGATTFFRPDLVAVGLHKAGAFVYRIFQHSQVTWQQLHTRSSVHWMGLLLAFLIPAFVCSTGTAIAVWMADEQLHPRTLLAYFRFGLYPYPSQGYRAGAQYSAVWGIPCHGVGTLGEVCQAREIAQKAVEWQKAVAAYNRGQPIPVAIVRLESAFDPIEARRLLNQMHYINGLAIFDVGVDFDLAYEVITQLTAFGLDGIAVDMEFAETVHWRDVERLATAIAAQRQEVGVSGKGILILWDVFHNVEGEPNRGLDEVQVIPIFTGYGPVDTKLAGLARTQQLFGVDPLQSGMMAFDQRWPVNQRCKTFNTTLGFDCQDWQVLFSHSAAANTGWWVQQ